MRTRFAFLAQLMSALLLFKQSPLCFMQFRIAARVDDTLIFVHRGQAVDFDPFTFAHAETFLARFTRLIQRAGYAAELIDPLSLCLNLL
jgi:hypothetical protein